MLRSSSLDVERWRAEFPTVAKEDRVHFNHCMVSPLPERGIEARRECERTWIEAHPHPWFEWYDKIDEVKERFADLINASPAEVAVVPSVTDAIASVSSAFDYGPGNDEVVTTEMEFPTMWQFWQAQSQHRGAEIRMAESADGERVATDAYADVIGDDTALVCTSHAFSATGGLMDPKPVADLVHDRGGYLFLDAYQSMGVVPIDVQEQDVDMLATGTTKFLFGGPGIAFLYVDADVAAELEPAHFGWFGSDDKFEAEDPDYAEGASRFQLGTPQITNTYQAGAGLSILQEVGVDTVHDRVVERTNHIIEGARDRGFGVATPDADDRRTAIVTVKVENHEEAFERMGEDGFMTSFVASQLVDGGLRLSPHFYTTPDEVEAALDALAENATPA